MVLPLAVILAAGVSGGAITGYAQEKQRQKIKEEEKDTWLEQLTAQEESQFRIAEKTSDLTLERELKKLKENNLAEYKKRLDKLGLPYGTSPAHLAEKEREAALKATHGKAKVEVAAKLNLKFDATPEEIQKAQDAQTKLKTDEEIRKKKAELDHKNKLENSINEAEFFSSSINIPGEFVQKYALGPNGTIPQKIKIPKKLLLPDPMKLLQSSSEGGVGSAGKAALARLEFLDNNVPAMEKIITGGSEQDKKTLITYLTTSATNYQREHLFTELKPSGGEEDIGRNYVTRVRVSTFADSAYNLAKSPYFGPLLQAIDFGKYKEKNVEFFIEELMDVNVIAHEINATNENEVNKDLLAVKNLTENDVFPSMLIKSKDSLPTKKEFDCYMVSAGTKEACETARTMLQHSKGEMTKIQHSGWMNLAIERSQTYSKGSQLGVEGAYIEGKPNGDGMVILDIIEAANTSSAAVNQPELRISNPDGSLNEQFIAEVGNEVVSTSLTAEQRKDFVVVPDMTGAFYQNVMDSAANVNADQFRWIIGLAQLAAPKSYTSNLSKDVILQKNGLIGVDSVASKSTSVNAAHKLGITLIQTNPDKNILEAANKNNIFRSIAARENLKADATATQLTGAFLGVYNDYFNVLGTQAKEFLKQAVGAENEEGFIAGFINMFNKNKGGEGTRWANIDLNDPNIEKNDAITEVRKASTYYQYDKNGKVTSQRAFKNNKEFIQAEKEASLRVQAGLAEIQANILKADKSSLDIVEARRELIKFMMAYELASFLQGGTGGRTISDQDVENMLRAIGAKGWTTSEAIVGGTLQLLAINSEKKDLYEALNSDDPSRVIGAIYARNKLLPRFRLDYKNDRKMMYNALEDLKNSPEGKDQEKKNLKYQFDENNQPIINEEKLEADAIIGVG